MDSPQFYHRSRDFPGDPSLNLEWLFLATWPANLLTRYPREAGTNLLSLSKDFSKLMR